MNLQCLEHEMAGSFITRLREGNVALGFGLMYPAPGIIEAIGRGWNWVWIDGQHGQHDYASLLECVRAADACGLGSIVRVPSLEFGAIGRVLDMRPSGIMIPMVETADQARAAANAAKFPPIGSRSYGGRRPIDLHGRAYFQTANEETLLVLQIETPLGAANAAEIARVEGADALFFGSDDMKMHLGIPIDMPAEMSPELAEAMKATTEATRLSKRLAGCVAASGGALRNAVKLGYRLIVGGSDVGFLRGAAASTLEGLDAALREWRAEPLHNVQQG
jgi:4-hydroxy-2-oxoheptanedioate aldolase